jgi:hypothetical protein
VGVDAEQDDDSDDGDDDEGNEISCVFLEPKFPPWLQCPPSTTRPCGPVLLVDSPVQLRHRLSIPGSWGRTHIEDNSWGRQVRLISVPRFRHFQPERRFQSPSSIFSISTLVGLINSTTMSLRSIRCLRALRAVRPAVAPVALAARRLGPAPTPRFSVRALSSTPHGDPGVDPSIKVR